MNEAPDHTVITARDLTKRYGEIDVVDHINFSIAKGETFGLLGPNGAGKTTTILMVLGLTEISAGAVNVVGDRGREGSSPPLPPNRAGGSPAHGSPVVGFPHRGHLA
jgi:ABC-type multidrug transport system ATPase subunit